MAYLKDLVKRGVSVKVKDAYGSKYEWDASGQFYDEDDDPVAAHHLIFNDDWELDGQTVDDVLKERGYVIEKTTDCSTQCGFTLIKKSDMCCGPNCNWLHLKTKPETVAELNRILDFMETLK